MSPRDPGTRVPNPSPEVETAGGLDFEGAGLRLLEVGYRVRGTLRSLDRAGLDWETIGASVRKTNAVLIAEQGPLGTSYGTLLGDEIQRRLFDWLDQPVERVLGGEASPSVSKVLERAALAGREEVLDGLRRVLAARGGAAAA